MQINMLVINVLILIKFFRPLVGAPRPTESVKKVHPC